MKEEVTEIVSHCKNGRKGHIFHFRVIALGGACIQIEKDCLGKIFGLALSLKISSTLYGVQVKHMKCMEFLETCTCSFITGASSSLEEEYKTLKEEKLCKLCMEREVEVTFLPCGHLVSCNKCAQPLKECPICRQRIRGFVRTYWS